MTELSKYFRLGLILAAVAFVTALVPLNPLRTLATGTNFSGGNILEGRNVTVGEGDYHDPVSASVDQHVRMLVRVVNQGGEDAQNTKVKFDLSSGTAPSVQVWADNAASQSDGLTLSPGGASLELVAGSGMKFGPGCASGCAVGDEIAGSGVNLGTVSPSEANSFQVGIEFKVVETPSGGGRPAFRGGNIFDGGNRSQSLGTWGDPVSAAPGDAVEFRTQVINDGNARSDNVSVRVELPTTEATTLTPRSFVSGAGAETVSDTTTVNVSGSTGQRLVYLPGHTRKFGPGCENGCNLPDGITVHGVTIGSVEPGVDKSFQVAFKVYVSNQQPQRQTVCDSLSVSPTSGNVPLAVAAGLSGHTTGGGAITSYKFNFGDGTGDFVQGSTSLSHTFNSLGTFTVRGYVKDNLGNENGGSGACQATITVNTVSSQRAICDSLSVSQNSGTAPVYVNSVLSGHTENGGSIVSYKFNFGDGTGDFFQSGNALGHTFDSVGTYVISGIVTDNLGNQAGGSVCQKVITAGQVLGVATFPQTIPKTGPETAGLFTLFGSGTLGWILRKFRVRI